MSCAKAKDLSFGMLMAKPNAAQHEQDK